MRNPHLAARVLGTPLLVSSRKLDAILSVLGPRLGLDLAEAPVEGPEAAAKAREGTRLEGRGRTRTVGQEPAAEMRVAVIQVVGTLANRVSWLDAASGMTSYETLAQELEKLADDPKVDGILLEFDSFGGEAAGCFDAADKIREARQQKPVFGVANQYAMSAAYALLSQCDRIFVPQTGEVGSIGVVTTHADFTAAAEKQGVRVTHVYAGARKVDLSPFRALSEEARSRLEADVHLVYDQFVAAVHRGRGDQLSENQARETEAGTFIGAKAVDAGLADEVGDKAAALSALFAEVEERRMSQEMAAENATLKVENAELRAKLAASEKAEQERQAREDDEYLERLRAESAAAQAPIDAAQLAKVEAHLKAGRREVAHELGDVLLGAAREKGAGKPFSKTSAGPPASNHQSAVVRGRARLLRRQGFKVEVSEDGSRIVSAVPPQNAR